MDKRLTTDEIRNVANIASTEILQLYWEDKGIPVDPFLISEQLDITVREIKVENSVAGGIWIKFGYPPIIFLNAGDHINRRRFTCAHELGHYYLRQGKEEEFESLDYRDNLSGEGISPVEIFANNFAANLLMPENEIRQRRQNEQSNMALAKQFGVSPEAMSFRLGNLRLG